MDPAEIRQRLQERLDFASRVVSTDGALVAYRVARPGAWIARSADPAVLAGSAQQLRAFDVDIDAGRFGFDYGQRGLSAIGGRGYVLVDRSRADALCAALDEAFRARTGGLPLAVTWVPFDPSDRADAQALALTRLRRELDIAVDLTEPPDVPGLGAPALGICPLCAATRPEATRGPCPRCVAAAAAAGEAERPALPDPLVAVAVAPMADALSPRLSSLLDLLVVGEVIGGVVQAALEAAGPGPVIGGDDARALCAAGRPAFDWVEAFVSACLSGIDRAAAALELPEKAQARFEALGPLLSMAGGPAAHGPSALLLRAQAGLPLADRARVAAEGRAGVAFGGEAVAFGAWAPVRAAAERLWRVPAAERSAPWLGVRDAIADDEQLQVTPGTLRARAAVAASPAWRACLGEAWTEANECLRALPDARARALSMLQGPT